jgi:hypothetical protein
MEAALLERALDLLEGNQGARRVVHSDIFRVAIDAIQASAYRILPAFAAGDNRADFFEACTGSDFFNFIMPFFTRHDYNFAYRVRALECADCVSDNWFARYYGKQFIEAHAVAAAAGYDDG